MSTAYAPIKESQYVPLQIAFLASWLKPYVLFRAVIAIL